MSKEIVALITCPHCGNDKATVHQQANRSMRGRLYYRCYPDDSEGCGTVQIIQPGGQAWINTNMRPLNSNELKHAAEQAASDAKVHQEKVAKKVADKVQEPESKIPPKRKSAFSIFLEDSQA